MMSTKFVFIRFFSLYKRSPSLTNKFRIHTVWLFIFTNMLCSANGILPLSKCLHVIKQKKKKRLVNIAHFDRQIKTDQGSDGIVHSNLLSLLLWRVLQQYFLQYFQLVFYGLDLALMAQYQVLCGFVWMQIIVELAVKNKSEKLLSKMFLLQVIFHD